MATQTSIHTLYRLTGIEPTPDGLLNALDYEQIKEIDGSYAEPPRFAELGITALAVTGNTGSNEATWCPEFRHTTGLAGSEPRCGTYGLLLLAVDGHVYAIGYDQGYRLIPDHLKDKSFGLTFALRAIDPDAVSGLTSKVMGQRRTDITMVPGGAPVSWLGIDEYLRIVGKVAGEVCDVELTRAGNGKVVKVDGGFGLRMHLGTDALDLVADIREVARVCRDYRAHPNLEFIEHVVPVRDPEKLAEIWGMLECELGDPSSGRVTFALPFDHLSACEQARRYRTKINQNEWQESDEFDLAYVLERASVRRQGNRLAALRNAKVELYSGQVARSGDRLASVGALRWLEANMSIGSRQFHLTDGQWYEIDNQYLPAVIRTLTRVITATSSLVLPSWPLGMSEGDYNKRVPGCCVDQNYVCLDTTKVSNPLKSPDTLEVCDLLAEDDTLVMVKQATGSDTLSHLFHQGLVAVQMLRNSPEVRERFAARVAEVGNGRVVPKDFTPKRVVFAILLKKGVELTPESLFAFSQVALAQAVKVLESWGVAVEVVGLKSDDSNVKTQHAAA